MLTGPSAIAQGRTLRPDVQDGGCLALLYFLSILGVITTAVAAIFHKGLRAGLKGGATVVAVLVGASFIYGLFHDFSLWHGHSKAGFDAGIGYAALLGFTCGPIAFVIGAIATAIACLLKVDAPPTGTGAGQEPPL